MEMIVVSNPVPLKREPEIVNELFDQGLRIFHLRKPEYTEIEYRNLLKKIKPEHHQKIALHQYHSLADEFGIYRFHYPEKQRTERVIQPKLNGQIYSTSVHYLKDFTQDLSCFDYLLMGPVFDSISKTGYKAMNHKNHPNQLNNNTIKIYGIGGITPGNGLKTQEYGFYGAAIMGYLWQQKDPAGAYQLLKKEWNTADQL
jgi:thiamine-phosphate pyrophosphorylase